MKFEIKRAWELLMPEAPILAGVAAGHLVARSMDMAFNLRKPFRRVSDWAHFVALGGSAILYAKKIWPDTTRTVFIGDGMLMVTSFADLLFQKTAAPRLRAIGQARTREEVARGGAGAGDTGRPEQLAAAAEYAQLGTADVEFLPGENIPVFVDEEIAA